MIHTLGYEVLDFDSGILKEMRSFIGKYLIGNAYAFDSGYGEVFNKGNRVFPPDISKAAAHWVSNSVQFKKALRYKNLEFDRLCNYELERNKELSKDQLHIYWRAVRPSHPEDVGPPHMDSQFYEIEEQSDDKRHVPIIFTDIYKVWIPVDGCTTRNALQVVPGSQIMKVPTRQIETKNGPKPMIEPFWLEEHESEFVCPFETLDNKCVVFSDKVVHRGPVNLSKSLRVSAEITVYVN